MQIRSPVQVASNLQCESQSNLKTGVESVELRTVSVAVAVTVAVLQILQFFLPMAQVAQE